MAILDKTTQLFDIPKEICYLNCSYMSPQLKSVTAAALHGAQIKSQPWKFQVDDFFEPNKTCKTLYAKLLHTNAKNIAIIPSASYGLSIAANNVGLKDNGEIVLITEQFPSNVYVWTDLAKQQNQKVVFVQKDIETSLTDLILNKLSSKTSVLSIANVHWSDGQYVDLEKIYKKTRELSIKLVLDLTQSLGVIDLDVNTVKADFIVASAYKWLLGPYSIAYLYCDDQYFSGSPIEHGWINKKGSSDFSKLVDYQDEYQIGAARYDMGGVAQFHLMPAAIVSLKQLVNWGVANIQDTIEVQTDYLSTQLNSIGLTTISKENRANHILGVFEGSKKFPENIVQIFKQNNIYVSFRGSSIRVGPYLYNTQHNLDHFLSILDDNII